MLFEKDISVQNNGYFTLITSKVLFLHRYEIRVNCNKIVLKKVIYSINKTTEIKDIYNKLINK